MRRSDNQHAVCVCFGVVRINSTRCGILTKNQSKPRDDWAVARRKLAAADETNKRYLHLVDTALFVLCLDHTSPCTAAEVCTCCAKSEDSLFMGFKKSTRALIPGCAAGSRPGCVVKCPPFVCKFRVSYPPHATVDSVVEHVPILFDTAVVSFICSCHYRESKVALFLCFRMFCTFVIW